MFRKHGRNLHPSPHRLKKAKVQVGSFRTWSNPRPVFPVATGAPKIPKLGLRRVSNVLVDAKTPTPRLLSGSLDFRNSDNKRRQAFHDPCLSFFKFGSPPKGCAFEKQIEPSTSRGGRIARRTTADTDFFNLCEKGKSFQLATPPRKPAIIGEKYRNTLLRQS